MKIIRHMKKQEHVIRFQEQTNSVEIEFKKTKMLRLSDRTFRESKERNSLINEEMRTVNRDIKTINKNARKILKVKSEKFVA